MKSSAAYLRWFRNKYIIAALVFMVLLLINERNSIFDQMEYRKNLREAKEKQAYYKEQLEKVKKDKEELFGNRKNLEKFAREKYLMKADDEEVFVMLEEEKK